MVLGWVSAKVPNGYSVKKWRSYPHQGGRNSKNANVSLCLTHPVVYVVLETKLENSSSPLPTQIPIAFCALDIFILKLELVSDKKAFEILVRLIVLK